MPDGEDEIPILIMARMRDSFGSCLSFAPKPVSRFSSEKNKSELFRSARFWQPRVSNCYGRNPEHDDTGRGNLYSHRTVRHHGSLPAPPLTWANLFRFMGELIYTLVRHDTVQHRGAEVNRYLSLLLFALIVGAIAAVLITLLDLIMG
jgi:hypothetical protein